MSLIKIGHKITWRDELDFYGTNLISTPRTLPTVYTVLDIKPDNPTNRQFLLQWQSHDMTCSIWVCSISSMDDLVINGQVKILNFDITPREIIPKFNFVK
jgi:hypothetical protein